jgi:hypothetical protein
VALMVVDTSALVAILFNEPEAERGAVDIITARGSLKAKGARVLGDGEPKIGAHGKPVLFLHPKDFCGTLVELEQA